MRDMGEGILSMFAESQARFGESLAEVIQGEWRAERERELDRERKSVARQAQKVLRAKAVMKECPTCGTVHEVLLHVHPGRVRLYCSDQCATTARVQRLRAAQVDELLAAGPLAQYGL